MFEPIRGGTRGGQAEFKWSDVSADKDRENYLGHSINAPTGRWQKNKDVHWYNRDNKGSEEERAAEIRRVKELEAEAMSVALGFGASKGASSADSAPATGANAVPGPTHRAEAGGRTEDAASKAAEAEERRRLKAKRKEEKLAHKERRRAERAARRDHSNTMDDRERVYRNRDRSRSRSPSRHARDDGRWPHSRRRSRTPDRSSLRNQYRSPNRGVQDDGYRRVGDRRRQWS